LHRGRQDIAQAKKEAAALSAKLTLQTPPDPDGVRSAGAERRILKRIRDAEQGHDPVTSEIFYGTALLPHGHSHQFINRLDQCVGAFLTEPLRNCRESNHIREQNRHLPSFA
jgi:hypothetical protein